MNAGPRDESSSPEQASADEVNPEVFISGLRNPPAAVRVEMEAAYRAQDLGRADAIAFTKHLYRLQRLGLAGGGDALEGGFLYRRAET